MRPNRLLLGAVLVAAVRWLSRRQPVLVRARGSGRRNTDHTLERIREEERAFIARELHDDLGQLLGALRVDMTLLLQRHPGDAGARALLEGMDRQLMSAITSLRRIAANLRPMALDEGGLFYALQSLCRDFEERYGLICLLDASESDLEFDEQLSTAVFRIVQEALTNTVRHARAQSVRLTLLHSDHSFVIVIEDDGRGIQQAEMGKTSSLGLLGMGERVRALRGTLAVTGGPQGTRIAVHIPMNPARNVTMAGD
ncbi:sensor histidine kinase [Massilia endophytica]|uniref:sensor histidine kinase n=1 Tax=Massilia endophytica TaxID=2899220 RepID=UPI001E3C20C5|nr:sensor histidine kinase [Massilia endophytica]UGQ47709.1 sensor histidine kinase [Massilia endophytica]